MSLSPADIRQLAGRRASVPNLAGGRVELVCPPQMRANQEFFGGNEGYAVACTAILGSGQIPAILKVFQQPSTLRDERSRFLVVEGIANLQPAWQFQGAPFMAAIDLFPGACSDVVSGHVARFVGKQYGAPAAKSLDRMRDSDWFSITDAERRRLAADLCEAVKTLEAQKFAHADISFGNVMVGPGPDGRQVAVLVDYDAFHHPNADQLKLPRAVRPIGSIGFQSPETIRRARTDVANTDEGIFVASDRFALAVMCCEMVAWSDKVRDLLLADPKPRPNLLSDDIIVGRAVDRLPRAIIDAFPEGFALLGKAMRAGSDAAMPRPEDWLEVLVPLATFRVPVVHFYRFGPPEFLHGKRLLAGATDNFGGVDSQLASVRYEKVDETPVNGASACTVDLLFDGAAPVVHRKRAGGTQIHRGPGGIRIRVAPGDDLASAGWRLMLEDRPHKP
jgi:hypothetical protein